MPDHPDPRPPAGSPLDPLADLRLDPPTWRERGEELLGLGPSSSPGRLVLAVLLAVGVVAVGAWYAFAGARPAGPVEATLPTASVALAPVSASDDGGGAPTTDTTAGRAVVAHAAGAVLAPGVYELAPGARVADLIEAAGGLRPDADADRLNLALVVADGSRLFVPVVGQQPPDELGVTSAPPPEGIADGTDDGGATGAGAPVDLNTADVTVLDTLPGVGPTTAQAIVDHRREHGRFERVDDLIDVRGIGEAKLAQLRDLVRV